MTITLRLVKGAPLTHAELDGNFEDLDGRFPVQTADIGDLQVTSGKLAADAVLTAKVADGNITLAKIQDASGASVLLGRGDSGAGDFEEITIGAGLTMTGTTLSAAGEGLPTDDTNPLVQDPVDTTKRARIDAGAVATATTRAIIMGDRDVNLASGGTFAELSHTHDAAAVASGTLADARVAESNVTQHRAALMPIAEADLGADAVTTAKIQNLAVTTAKIANEAVDGTKLADGAISTANLAAAAVDTVALADDAVTSAKLADTAVTPGSYTNMNATVDQQGRITAASSGGPATGLLLVDDDSTSFSVTDALDGTYRQLTAGTAITVTLDAQQNAKGTRVGLERAGAGLPTVEVESGAGYFTPGQDVGGTPATGNFNIAGYIELVCIGYNGQSTNITDAVWGTPTGNNVTVTSAGNNLPALEDGQRITVRNHSVSDNNGDYVVSGTPTTGTVDLTKETGGAPQAAAAEAVDIDHGCAYKLYGQDNLADALDADLDINNFDLLNIGDGTTFEDPAATRLALAIPAVIPVAASDETTPITAGAGKVTFHMPFAMDPVTEIIVGVTTSPTGANLIVDINEGGTTILSTKATVEAGEETSLTATNQPVLSDTALAKGAKISIDFDQVGSTVEGTGVKVYIIGVPA